MKIARFRCRIFFSTTLTYLIPLLPAYTLLSTLLGLFLLPLFMVAALTRKKYRGRSLQRLGLTLHNRLPQRPKNNEPILWIHALSVGEVTSALPLIQGLRLLYPQATLYLSTTTKTGLATADQLTSSLVDALFFSPFDLFFCVHRFINLLHPSLFILVETDFWPGWLWQLNKKKIPCLLVNGRFSRQSITRYQRFGFLFKPMFDCFKLLSLQTRQDCDNLKKLGITKEKIVTLGNLKFDAGTFVESSKTDSVTRSDLGLTDLRPLLICGSTHRGEEEILFTALQRINKYLPDLFMILAPRDINRASEIEHLAQNLGITTSRRTEHNSDVADVLLLDTLGELAACYFLADIAFIGGSLVPAGGHNPLEAASAGIPVLFGPHMEDFTEISLALIVAGGAYQVTGNDELERVVLTLLSDDKKKGRAMGGAAKQYVISSRGVVDNHLAVIDSILDAHTQGVND